MSSSQILSPDSEDIAEDLSIPTLSNPSRLRLLVVPPRLQGAPLNKSYGTRSSAKNLGKLKGFLDLPMDLVFETAMYLTPSDLLQLSRLSKQFRSMFTSRSAIFVWRTVFRDFNVKCPEDLNELELATLLYDRFCMACGRMRKKCSLFLALRLRLCPSCQTANLVTLKDLRVQYPDALDLIVHLPSSWGVCFKPEAKLMIEKFSSLKKENSTQFIANMREHTRVRYQAIMSILPIGHPWSTVNHGYTARV